MRMKLEYGLFERLSEETISLEDAEAWAELILPIRDTINGQKVSKTAFLYDMIYNAMLNRMQIAVSDKASDEEDDDYILSKLSQMDDDPYEKARWRIIAGYLDCRDPERLNLFAQRIFASQKDARAIRIRLEDLAVYEKIEPPLPSYSEKNTNNGIDASRIDLKKMKEKIQNGCGPISYLDSVVWCQALNANATESDDLPAVEYALKNLSEPSWIGNEQTEKGKAFFQSAVDIAMGNPRLCVRHLIMTWSHICMHDIDARMMFSKQTGLDDRESVTLIQQLFTLAAKHQILSPDGTMKQEHVYVDGNNELHGLRGPGF